MAQITVPMEDVSVTSFIDVGHYDIEATRTDGEKSIAEDYEGDSIMEVPSDVERERAAEFTPEEQDHMSTAPSYSNRPASTSENVSTTGGDYPSQSSVAQRLNSSYDRFTYFTLKNSIYLCVIFWALAMAFGLTSFIIDSWRYSAVKYDGDGFSGRSVTVLGAYSLKRYDNAVVGNDTYMMLSKKLTYEDIMSEGYCDADSAQKVTQASVLEQVLFRPLEKVGNLNAEDVTNFVTLHGKTVYDVLCTGIADIARAGKLIFIIGILSYVLFALMSYFVIKRVCYPYATALGDVETAIGRVGVTIWMISLALGSAAFACYFSISDDPFCISEAGTPKICHLYYSTHYFLFYLNSNAICLIAYVLNSRSLAVEYLARRQSKV